MSKAAKTTIRYYRCKHCGMVVQRDSTKKWIKSYCENTRKGVQLMLSYSIIIGKDSHPSTKQ